ncbi:uncharacterized protein LOC119604159 isoform X1 [Lucilia sericata]|uniref:uncharacterized protein LOC119604159 isoform X1 n=2 Tax=Lucilia sericata TaxID=13632 RepID=UPI0018A802BE|nr:uncharacterized protein LOC119604159 isoform X1 [Lucilia sericata]
MRVSLPGDMLMSTVFDTSMVLQNHNTIAARSLTSTTNSGNTAHSTASPATDTARVAYRMSQQRPIVDLLVAMIAVPILILCALQLEKNLHDMANSPESRWLVFALGIGMLIVSVIICGYVTHRMGVCIWAGPIDEVGNRVGSGSGGSRGVTHINSQNDILRIVDSLPPSYDSVVKFDIPPPPYDCLVIDMEQCKDEPETEDKPTVSTQNSTVHM